MIDLIHFLVDPSGPLPATERLTCTGEIFSLQCAAGGSAALELDAPIPTFSGVAYSGGLMNPKGARLPVCIDLRGLRIQQQELPACRQHDHTKIVGRTSAINNNLQTITCAGVCSGDETSVVDISRRDPKFPWQLSIDADCEIASYEELRAGASAVVNSKRITGPAIIVRRSELRMIDFVVKGGDRHAKATIQAAGGSPMTFAEWLLSLGLDESTLSPEATTALTAQFEATQGDSLDAVETETETALASAGSNQSIDAASQFKAELLKERRRTKKILEVCEAAGSPSFLVQGVKHDLADFAIANDWDPRDAELEAVRASRPKAPAGHVKNIQASADVMSAAMMMSIGCDLEKPLPRMMQLQAAGKLPDFLFDDINSNRKQEVLQAAYGMRNLSSMGFAERTMQGQGIAIPHGGVTEVLEAASSSNFGNVITTTAFVSVLESFAAVEDTTMLWTEEDATCVNFLETKQVGLKAMGGTMPILPPGGTAEEAFLSDKGELFKVNRHAKKLTIDEQTMMNDQLGQILKGMGEFGDMAGRVRPDLVYALLLNNPTMGDTYTLFHANHSNVGASDNLTSAYLKAAIAALLLAKETDEAGNIVNIGTSGKYLLLPPSIALTGDELINSSERVGSVTADAMINNALKDQGLIRISDPRMENGVVNPATKTMVTGSSAKWYVCGDRRKAIKVGFLKSGGKIPQVRRTVLQNGQWGIGLDAKFDIGVGAVRYQSIFRST